MKTVGFKISLPLARETRDGQKSMAQYRKGFSAMEKKELPAVTKRFQTFGKEAKKSLKDVGDEAEKTGRKVGSAWDKGLHRLGEFGKKLHETREKLFGLKEALEATAVGAAAAWGFEKIVDAGKKQFTTKARLKREFGDEAEGIEGIAGGMANRSGISKDAAALAMVPLAEQLQQVQAGARFRGMKKPLTEAQATALRKKNLAFGSELIGRLSLMAPEIAPEEIGRVTGDALAGPEGIRSLIATFNLSKRSRNLATLNEHGKAFEGLSPSERQQTGLKRGQYLEQGDLVRLILERSGITAGAAAERGTHLDVQIKSIGSAIEDALGDIGVGAMTRFNGKMKEGETLASRFRKYLEEHKETLHSIGDSLASGAESVGKLVGKLPALASFLTEHKGTLLAMGAGFYALKGAAYFGAKSSSGGGALGGLGGLGGLGSDGMRVFVTNWGGSKGGGLGGSEEASSGLTKFNRALGVASAAVGAFSAGFGLGTFLDEKYDISGGMEKGLHILTGNKDSLNKPDQVVKEHTWDILKGVLSGDVGGSAQKIMADAARDAAAHPDQWLGPPQIIQLNVDGKKMAEVVTGHMGRDVQRKTANGAAPATRD